MHPILFHIGDFPIASYGVNLAIAFIISTFLLGREAERQGLDKNDVMDVAVYGLVVGLLCSKLLLILLDLNYYLSNPGEILKTLRSAGVLYGGQIGGLAFAYWLLRRRKLPAWKTFDIAMPYLALAIGLGRISCLLAGCCHGMPYDGPFAIVFPDAPYCEAPPGVSLFPVQALAVINGILLFALLLWVLRKHYRFPGQVAALFMGLYGLTRGLLEFLRGDDVRGLWLGGLVSTSQLIALGFMILAAALYFTLKKRAEKHGA